MHGPTPLLLMVHIRARASRRPGRAREIHALSRNPLSHLYRRLWECLHAIGGACGPPFAVESLADQGQRPARNNAGRRDPASGRRSARRRTSVSAGQSLLRHTEIVRRRMVALRRYSNRDGRGSKRSSITRTIGSHSAMSTPAPIVPLMRRMKSGWACAEIMPIWRSRFAAA